MNSSSMEAMATRAAQSPTHSPPPPPPPPPPHHHHHHHHHHQSSGSNSCCSNGGVQIHSTTTPPLTPISRSDTNPYPTTFVQADTSTFKQVVQMLTGSSETAKQASNSHQDPTPTPPITPRNNSSNFSIPPIRNTPKKQQQQNSNNFKLYERRNNNHKATLMINTLLPNLVNSSPAGFSPRNKQQEILSPSLLDFPKLTLSSPVTPLNDYDPFNRNSSSSEEDRAIAEKGFYLHPSPMSTPRDSEPQLLSLFPVTSPRIPGSSTS